jgi:hypothetical protein
MFGDKFPGGLAACRRTEPALSSVRLGYNEFVWPARAA